MSDHRAAIPVLAVDGVIRDYDWGSTTEIQSMLGVVPDGRPAAELWFGDHPGAPSRVGSHTLDEVLASDPVGLLGADSVARFGPRLPFLMKVLAAERPLSIQVHPNLEQARSGFAAEDDAGVARDDPRRNFVDPNHKPELLCALTPFEALCGFRPVDQTLTLLEELAIPELDFAADALSGPDPIRAAFVAILTHDDPGLLADAVARRADPDGPLRPAYLAAQAFPGDVGVALTVLLNYVRLEPGEAVFLGAGNVHAYLRGTGVEIMAASDNVLRCGLTRKHIDVDELLRIADFGELREPVWPGEDSGFDLAYRVPVPDFALTRIDVDAYGVGDGTGGSLAYGLPQAQLVLCTSGHARVEHAGSVVELVPGHAAFVPFRDAAFGVRGTGTVFVAGADA